MYRCWLGALIALLLLTAPETSWAQEEESETALIESVTLTDATEEFIRETNYPFSGGRMHMVPPYVCTYRDFFIDPRALTEHAGTILRILQGECAGNVHAYIHNRNPELENPRIGRIMVLTDADAISLLERLAEITPPPAPVATASMPNKETPP